MCTEIEHQTLWTTAKQARLNRPDCRESLSDVPSHWRTQWVPRSPVFSPGGHKWEIILTLYVTVYIWDRNVIHRIIFSLNLGDPYCRIFNQILSLFLLKFRCDSCVNVHIYFPFSLILQIHSLTKIFIIFNHFKKKNLKAAAFTDRINCTGFMQSSPQQQYSPVSTSFVEKCYLLFVQK